MMVMGNEVKKLFEKGTSFYDAKNASYTTLKKNVLKKRQELKKI